MALFTMSRKDNRMQYPPKAAALRAAFTLIELLIVIAIIAILASILFPVFSRAREQGRKAACLSNERQISQSILLYIQDYDTGYPNTNDPYLWVGKRFRWPLMPYLAIGQKVATDGSYSASTGSPAVLICPSDYLSASVFDGTSYGYSASFYHDPTQIAAMNIGNLRVALNAPGSGALCSTQTEAALQYPSQKIMVGEYYNAHEHPNAPVGYWGTLSGTSTPGPDRWDGSRNEAFADGHVKFLQAHKINPSPFDCPDFNLTVGGISGLDLN